MKLTAPHSCHCLLTIECEFYFSLWNNTIPAGDMIVAAENRSPGASELKEA
jgi:hypothetical protein